MSASALQSLEKEGMQQVYCMSTSRRHSMSSGNRLTHCALQKHSSSTCIHVQGGVERIQRVPTV
eukprot:6145241-Amphidinium_carterae.1